MDKFTRRLGGTDFDFRSCDLEKGSASLDGLEQLRAISQYLPDAESAEVIVYPKLETKDSLRVRIKIIYREEVMG